MKSVSSFTDRYSEGKECMVTIFYTIQRVSYARIRNGSLQERKPFSFFFFVSTLNCLAADALLSFSTTSTALNRHRNL